MTPRKALTSIPLLLICTLVAGQEALPSAFILDIHASQILRTTEQYQQFGFDGQIDAGPVAVDGQITFQNDGKYGEAQGGYWLGFNGVLDAGGVSVDLPPFTLRAGRYSQRDLVDSPYSLFVSAREIPALHLDLGLETPILFYDTRWFELNRDSSLGYPDRGASLKSYGLKFNRLRVGFQDAVVYTGRSFDFEYLMSPIPGFFTQYIQIAGGSPWEETGNDNSLLGFFADYRGAEYSWYSQILIDDFNANAIVAPDSFQNPNKIAWSLGGLLDTRIGTVGLYHAGATKYTFQAYGGGSPGSASDTKYGYTYYPAMTYEVDGDQRIIWPEDNYIGYLHGENNLAFLATIETAIEPVDIDASLELTISGSKSPANPWHEYNTYTEGGQGTRFLNDDRLETRIVASGHATYPLGNWLFTAGIELGYVANELELTQVPITLSGGDPDNETPYLAPGETNRAFAGLVLGLRYHIPITGE